MSVKQKIITKSIPKVEHVYLSTACHHLKHDHCRYECKFCSATCVCECHLKVLKAKKPKTMAAGQRAYEHV